MLSLGLDFPGVKEIRAGREGLKELRRSLFSIRDPIVVGSKLLGTRRIIGRESLEARIRREVGTVALRFGIRLGVRAAAVASIQSVTDYLYNLHGLMGEQMRVESAFITARVAEEVERTLQTKGDWPTDSGRSRKGFRARLDRGSIVVSNTARSASGFPYASYVNNARQYRNGAPNPNYQKAQRIVRQNWRAIIRKAGPRNASQ